MNRRYYSCDGTGRNFTVVGLEHWRSQLVRQLEAQWPMLMRPA